MTEVWKPVPGYEGLYEVSDAGQVRRISTGRIIKPKVEKNGYVRVHLSNKTAESILLHRIVAKAFVDNPNGFKTVNHIDEDKQNNCASNLEWCDMSYQNSYGKGAESRNKAKERPVLQYTKEGQFIRRYESIKQAGESLKIPVQNIWKNLNRYQRQKSVHGFVFNYEGGDA